MFKKLASVVAISALLVAGLTATPAMAVDATFVPESNTTDSGFFSTVQSDQVGKFDVPAGHTTFAITQRFALNSDFVTSHLGETLSLSVVVTDPNGNEVSASDGSQTGVTYSVRKQETIAGEISAIVALAGSELDQTALIDAGLYSVDVTLSANDVSVETDANVTKDPLVATYALGTSPVTVPANTVSSSISAQICLDSTKIAVGDVVKAEAWFDGALVSSTANFSTRSSYADPTKASYRSGASAALSITVNKFDQSFGTAAKFSGLSVAADSDTSHTYGFKLYKTSNNADVSGTCAPATPVAPTVAIVDGSISATGALTFGAGNSGTICDFYDQTAPDVKVKAVYAQSGAAGTSTYTCTFGAGIGGRTYFAKVTQRYQSIASAASPASVDIRQPLRTLNQTPVPTISGEATVDQTLTAEENSWDDGTAFAYQWFASGVAIDGAIERTFTLTIAELATTITVSVTGSLDGYTSVTRTSASTVSVGAVDNGGGSGVEILDAPLTAILGDAITFETLTADTSAWPQDIALSFQWFIDGEPIDGATESTYVLSSTDGGHAISVSITGAPDGTNVLSSTSDSVDVSLAEQTLTPIPEISGVSKVGKTLTAVTGDWADGVQFEYQWFIDDDAVDGATEATFALPAASVGGFVSVAVTGYLDGYNPSVQTSDAQEVLLGTLVKTPVPTIGGSAKAGQKLTAVTGTWDADVEFAYEWKVAGKTVAGADQKTFVIPGSALGKTITVTVTGSKDGYQEVSKTSKVTAKVAIGAMNVFATPTIVGTVVAGKSVTVAPGTWVAGAKFAYVWLLDGKAIKGAKAAKLAIAKTAKGHKLSVSVTATAPGFTALTKVSKVVKVG